MAEVAFLQIPGIPGNAKDAEHRDWIELHFFEMTVSSPRTPAGKGGDSTKSQAFTIRKNPDKATPSLSEAFKHNTSFSRIVIEFVHQDADHKLRAFYRSTFDGVTIQSIRWIEPIPSGASKSSEPSSLEYEEVVFAFRSVSHDHLDKDQPVDSWTGASGEKQANSKLPAGPAASPDLRQAVLHVRVVDEKGAERVPKGNDRVEVSGKPLKYGATDGFKYEIKGQGDDLLLEVKYDGFETVQQFFRYDAPAERPTLAPSWPGTDDDPMGKGRRPGYLLACMDLSRTAGGHDDLRSPKVFNLTVTLHPTRMYVAIIGCDYWEDVGTPKAHHRSLDFETYSLTYADHIVATGVLNLSSPFLMADCPRGRLVRWDRIRNGAGTVWKRHFIEQKWSPVAWPSADSFDKWRNAVASNASEAAKYLAATDIYKFLSSLGKRVPGAVADFSIFSHSWMGGPILYDTFESEDPDHPANTRTVGDLDMRFKTDFIAPNVNDWPQIPAAFASDGTIHVWGCFATDIFNEMVRFLLGEGGVKGRFVYDSPKVDLDRGGVIAALKRTIDKQSFMSRIAKFTGRKTFGGLPGFGSDNGLYGNIRTVASALKGKVQGQIMYVPRIVDETRFRGLFESADLGSQQFNEFGYMLYKP